MATKSEGVSCFEKAGDDEPVFVLRAKDVLAPEVVRDWAERARSAGVNPDKIVEALNVADKMELWQDKHIPD